MIAPRCKDRLGQVNFLVAFEAVVLYALCTVHFDSAGNVHLHGIDSLKYHLLCLMEVNFFIR